VELSRALGLTQERGDLLSGEGRDNSELVTPKQKAAIRGADEVPDRPPSPPGILP